MYNISERVVCVRRLTVCLLALLLCALCACGKGGDGSADVDVDCEYLFESFDDLAGYLIENRNGEQKSFFESASQRVPGELTVYSPGFLPEGYELERIRLFGSFISMYYKNGEGERITFVCGFLTDGDEYLKNAAETFELDETDGMPGYFSAESRDDDGNAIYMIYWSEYGNSFQANIPTDAFGQCVSGGALAIETSSYPF